MSSSTRCANANTRVSSLYLTNMHGSLVNSMYALVTRGSLKELITRLSDMIFITIDGRPIAAFTAGSVMTASTCAGVSDDTSFTTGGPSYALVGERCDVFAVVFAGGEDEDANGEAIPAKNEAAELDGEAADADPAVSTAVSCSIDPFNSATSRSGLGLVLARLEATELTEAPIHSPAPAMPLPTSAKPRPAALTPSIVAVPTAPATVVNDLPAASKPFLVSTRSR